MDTNKVFDTYKELDRLTRTAGHSARLYAERARQAIVEAYKISTFEKTCVLRQNASTTDVEKANKIVELGTQNVVFGSGRSLLSK